MNVIQVPFVKQEDDEKCALLNANTNRYSPVPEVVNEVWKVLTLMPDVRTRIALKLKNIGELA